MKIAVLDVWRHHDKAEFRTVLPALRARGIEVIDLFVDPSSYATSHLWVDAMLARLDEDTTRDDESIKLLGFCAGGRVALALSERLEQRGTPPSFIGLIETWQRSPLVELDRALYSRYGVGERLMVRQQIQWLLSAPEASFRALARCYRQNWKSIVRRSSIERRSKQKSDEPNEWLIMNFTHATGISPVTTNVHIFNTRGSVHDHFGDPSLGLAPYLRGGFNVHYLEGDHHSCTKEPFREGLVSQIISCMETLSAP